MVNRKRLITNTALLTGSSLAMSLISMSFQVWLVGRIGSAGIGLYQLVISVSFLCTTFAVSGIRFTSTRLVSEELGSCNEGGIGAAMARCFAYCLFFGVSAMLILHSCAEPIGFLWIGDARTVRSLRITAFSMPFISLTSAMGGYFTACGRVWKPTVVHISEQLITIGFAALFLIRAPSGDIEASCAAVMLGSVAGDVVAFLVMLCFFLGDLGSYGSCEFKESRLTRRMLKLALPLAVSAYARSALSTLEHMLVPRGLRASGLSADSSLSGYGTIQGMVMPILSFPACILISLSELMIPELTEAQVRGDNCGIRKLVRSIIKKSLGYSIAAALFLFCFADGLGELIYHSADAGHYLRLLAPLVPVMYTDTIVDGCLKGLGQQVWSMGINILDAALGVVLVLFILPEYALAGYIAIIYFNECLNFTLSALRLSKVVRSHPQGQGRTAQRL